MQSGAPASESERMLDAKIASLDSEPSSATAKTRTNARGSINQVLELWAHRNMGHRAHSFLVMDDRQGPSLTKTAEPRLMTVAPAKPSLSATSIAPAGESAMAIRRISATCL